MPRPTVHGDFETRSVIDLPLCGTAVYAQSPTTDALCLSWAIEEGPVKLWRFLENDPPPSELFYAIKQGAIFVAHNAPFEDAIWNKVCVPKYGWPVLPLNQMRCTQVMAYAMGLQGSLENAAKNVGLAVEKDMQGHRIMMQLSQPRSGPDPKCVQCNGTGYFWYQEPAPETCECVVWWSPKDIDPKHDVVGKFNHLYRYCISDLIVERELFKRLLMISNSEYDTWLLDQKINERGVYVNLKAAKKAIELARYEQRRLNAEIKNLTNGAVSTVNAHVRLAEWIRDFGIVTDGVDKAHVLDMLELDGLPEVVKKVLKIRQEAAKSSVAKLEKMVSGASEDSRVRGCFQFNGAAATGRWAGRRIQLHNLPRPKMKQNQIEQVIKLLGE